jgi:hypothetical protein
MRNHVLERVGRNVIWRAKRANNNMGELRPRLEIEVGMQVRERRRHVSARECSSDHDSDPKK